MEQQHLNTSYRPNDLRALDSDTALMLVNTRLKELRDDGKRLADFKCEILAMSNSSAHQIMTSHFGFIKPRSEYYYREKTDSEKNTTSSHPPKEHSTSNHRYQILDSIRNTEQVDKIRTSCMICADTHREWNDFCQDHYMFDKTLLHDAALRMYMKYFKKNTDN